MKPDFRPMRAPQNDPITDPAFFDKLQYPLLVSWKYDGIRGVTISNTAYSSTMKPLPSYQVQDELGPCVGIEVEIIAGDNFTEETYNRTQSHVMSADKPGELTYHAFDYIHPSGIRLPFWRRLEKAAEAIKGFENISMIPHSFCNSYEELMEMEEVALEAGAEGLMMRNPEGRYKNGPRATMKEAIIYKLKRVETLELKLHGLEEKMHNQNELEENELGLAKRSSSKEGKVSAGTTGKFIVEWEGTLQSVAPGAFKHHELQEIWNCPEKFIGRFMKVKHFPKGAKDKLRQPRAQGWVDNSEIFKG